VLGDLEKVQLTLTTSLVSTIVVVLVVKTTTLKTSINFLRVSVVVPSATLTVSVTDQKVTLTVILTEYVVT
jgi:hypothetical protein